MPVCFRVDKYTKGMRMFSPILFVQQSHIRILLIKQYRIVKDKRGISDLSDQDFYFVRFPYIILIGTGYIVSICLLVG